MSYAFKFIKNDIKEIMNSSETTSSRIDQAQSICDMEDKLEKNHAECREKSQRNSPKRYGRHITKVQPINNQYHQNMCIMTLIL